MYPSAIQSLVVNPNQQSREAPYIDRNVLATRAAMGIDRRRRAQRVRSSRSPPQDVESDLEPLRNVRLLNPTEMLSRFRSDRARGRPVDQRPRRRPVRARRRARSRCSIAARELDLDGSPNQSWQGRHLINTRGCGLVMAPVGQVLESDRPDYQAVEGVERPELYFSPSLTGYAVAGTAESERLPGGEAPPYSGTAGVQISSFLRRAGVRPRLPRLQRARVRRHHRGLADAVGPQRPRPPREARSVPVLRWRPVSRRRRRPDQWVIDAYTTTNRYPYGQRIGNEVQLTANSGLPRDANYVRNSVKAIVDAYDGAVTFYVSDPDDPVIQAWQGAFGDLFSPFEDMPQELRDHLRYPEDLFRVQTDVYSKYQLQPADFFERDGAWSVAQAPGVDPRGDAGAPQTPTTSATEEEQAPSELASESEAERFVPYYTMFANAAGEAEDNEFVLMRPFVPFSRNDQRTELQAYMTASSDPETYGRLTAYVVDGVLPDGPRAVANLIDSEPSIAQQITLQTGGGNRVIYGDLQLVPVGDGLIYVRPFYAAVPQGGTDRQTTVTEYRFVIVSNGSRAQFGDSIGEALAKLFPGFEGDLGDRVGGAPLEDEDDEQGTEAGATEGTAPELLARAADLLQEANDALTAGDLGEYQAKVNEAGALVDQALGMLGPPTSEG